MPGSAAPPELRRLVPGAEWKADIALTLAGGEAFPPKTVALWRSGQFCDVTVRVAGRSFEAVPSSNFLTDIQRRQRRRSSES